jgi:hypothetical protein
MNIFYNSMNNDQSRRADQQAALLRKQMRQGTKKNVTFQRQGKHYAGI